MDLPWLRQPVNTELKALAAELHDLWQCFDRELRQGKLKHLDYDPVHKKLLWHKLLAKLRLVCKEANEEPLAHLTDRMAEALGEGPHLDYNAFIQNVEQEADKESIKLSPKRLKLLQTVLAERDEEAAAVIKKIYKSGKAEEDSIRGVYSATMRGKPALVEYEPDADLRDTEQVPLLEEGGVEAFFRREVLPYTPDAWINEEATALGYEILFTQYFYKPQPLRSLKEIQADILKAEKETGGLLSEIIQPREHLIEHDLPT